LGKKDPAMFPVSIHGQIETGDSSRQQIDAAIDRLVAAFAGVGAKPAERKGDKLTFHGHLISASVLTYFDSCSVTFEPNRVVYEVAWVKQCVFVVGLGLLTCGLWPLWSPDVAYIMRNPLFIVAMSIVLVAACYVGARRRISDFLRQAIQPPGQPLTLDSGDRTVA
jgi:hypothetical protein